MKNTNCRKTTINRDYKRSNHPEEFRNVDKTNSVSVSASSNWTELSKKVLRENIGAWETLAKE